MYVEREIKGKFAKLSAAYPIIAVVGARQAGKSTFLKEWMKGKNGSYVLFDDPDAKALFEADIKKFERQYLEGRGFAILDEFDRRLPRSKDDCCGNRSLRRRGVSPFGRPTNRRCDLWSTSRLRRLVGNIANFAPLQAAEYRSVGNEVQYCKDAGTKLKYLADSGRKIFISSSSEILLGKEVLSFLVGRVSVLRLYPFSYSEFLRARGVRETGGQANERMIWEHAVWGGYPKAVLTEDVEIKRTILYDLYQTMVLKDVARTFAISDVGALESLSKRLAHGIGGITSYEEICRELGVSFVTLKKYLDVMEKSWLIVRVPPYFSNKLKEITKRPKLYFIDTGLRNAIAGAFPNELDEAIFENYVLCELLKMGFSVRYWRTKGNSEVDFVVETEGGIVPIEVKLNAPLGRVDGGLRSFISSYKPKAALVVSYRGERGEIIANGCRVKFVGVDNMGGALGVIGKRGK